MRQPAFEKRCPETTRLLTRVVGPDLMLRTPFAFAFFSTLHAGAAIAPHAAPCNLRLRVHLPLVQVAESVHECGLRVGSLVVPWREGRSVVFDDSFEHEAWNRTARDRVVLLFDVWHPDLNLAERIALIDMFDAMKKP